MAIGGNRLANLLMTMNLDIDNFEGTEGEPVEEETLEERIIGFLQK